MQFFSNSHHFYGTYFVTFFLLVSLQFSTPSKHYAGIKSYGNLMIDEK